MSAGLHADPATGTKAPGPPRLRRLPMPSREPFAVRRVMNPDPPAVPSPMQGTLALVLPDRPDLDGPLEETAAVADDPSEARDWATRLLTAAIEVAAGVRSPAQLVRWTSLDVHASLARRGALAARARRARPTTGTRPIGRSGRPVLRTMRLSSPREGVHEVTAVVADGSRVRAVAMRLEGLDGRWRVTALDIG